MLRVITEINPGTDNHMVGLLDVTGLVQAAKALAKDKSFGHQTSLIYIPHNAPDVWNGRMYFKPAMTLISE